MHIFCCALTLLVYFLKSKEHLKHKKTGKIIRTWKGWTTLENAPIYGDMLINDLFPALKNKGVKGLEKVNISVRDKKNEVEFFLILQFDSHHAVKVFAGENYELAYIPENAQRIMLRYDEIAQHYEFRKELVL